ncbi:cystathionine beta-lyase [Chitinasiproducens palmae]|uniref:Cystathionine beta-lyase n=1 Tax=Chitinasiproducens palmae TaxID=1770053 RepID=A0A1H2PW48_9BURK|nr:cystathionine beta-lyase [Chitinasiproducens palmae]SDV51602.1 cystathionine beta-lyase [Chitinasiproducens palmae]
MNSKPSGAHSLVTQLLHDDTPSAPGFDAFPVAVARASTVVFPDLATMRDFRFEDDTQWRYGLHGTPTSRTLERRLAMIEGGKHALLQPSGLASISNVYFAFLRQGDDVLVPDNAYTPNRDHGDWLARDFGVSVRYYDPMIGAGIAALLQDNTRLVWVEAPGSVTMEVPDVPAIAAAAHAHGAGRERGVIVAIDNTYAAGLSFKPFEHGCDVSVQALTKYQSGASDVLMGATISNDAAIHGALKRARMRLGLGVSADDCSLLLRSLATLEIRYAAHERTALSLAAWLKLRPEIDCVLHPGLPDCAGHEHWRRDFTGAGGLFSVIFEPSYSAEQVDAFVEGLSLFKIGFSWGGAHSLAVPYRIGAMRTASEWPHSGQLVRFFIGLESEDDLRADLEQSLSTHLVQSPA